MRYGALYLGLWPLIACGGAGNGGDETGPGESEPLPVDPGVYVSLDSTQVLTDLYTVYREKGRIDGLRWLAVVDMRMRTMHSLAHGLTQFDCPITFVSPPELALTDEFK